MSRPAYPLVEVEWLDAEMRGHRDWVDPQVTVFAPTPMRTGGYLYEDTPTHVVVGIDHR